ncbi:MAG: hypothetical protein RBU37_17040 [Myxococcota bacterium]|jgi:hypothetical protein|nr:hypothetical protein [Myxococcota bacterium]
MRRTPSERIWTLSVLLFFVVLFVAAPVWSQNKPKVKQNDAVEQASSRARSQVLRALDAANTAQSVAYVVPPWCGHRPALSAVFAYDDGKWFAAVAGMSESATETAARSLCPGDTVRMGSFGTQLQWWGEAIDFEGTSSMEEMLRRVKKRPAPSAQHSINDALLKAAFEYWDERSAERTRALFVFTDTIESDAPPRHVGDWNWNEIPSFVAGQLLLVVSLLEKSSPANRPLVYVTAAPKDKAISDFPSGGTTSYADLWASYIPVEAPPAVEQSAPVPVQIRIVQGEASWLEQPKILAILGVGVALLVIAAYLLGRWSVRRWLARQTAQLPKEEVPELTLILRDRYSGRVVREETRLLSAPLRLGSGSGTDFFVPGPYVLELRNEKGQGPVLRSANMLGLEVIRNGGRRMAIADGELVKLSSGDRVDIGGGQEVELRLH